MTIRIGLEGDRELERRFTVMPDEIRRAVLAKMWSLGLMVERYIKERKLSGQVLHRRSGRLSRSIYSQVEDRGDQIVAYVGSSSDVPYNAAHEFGVRTKPHVIEPDKKKALAFMMDGKQFILARVNHPGSRIPERSYMRSSIADNAREITEGLRQALDSVVDP